MEISGVKVYCQACGAANPDEQEYCRLCHQKLLVLSGAPALAEEAAEESIEEQFSFDEHLLERISILEEAVKRTAEMMRQALDTLRRQEKSILVNQTGLASLQELLEQKRLLARDEWSDLWSSRMDDELLALERRDRFVGLRERIAALFQGVAERREHFLQHLEDAEYAFYGLDTARALDALEAAHAVDPGNLELVWFLGETYFNEGDPERALPFFRRVLETDPDHYEGLVYSGVIHHERGDAPKARQYLERAVELYPDAFLPHFTLGGIHADRREPRQAVECLERAVAIEPLPQALFLLGSAHYELGRSGLAIRRLQEAVRSDPVFEEAHHLLGLAYLRRGWKHKALEAFRRAQRLNPRKMRYQDVVSYLSGQGETPLPQVPGEAGRWFARGEDKLRKDDLRGALGCYRRALAIEPDNPTLLMSYALLCLELDRVHEIEEVAKKVLALDPGEMLEATACAALIEALRSEGRLDEGDRIGRELLAHGHSAFTRTIAYYELACNLAAAEASLGIDSRNGADVEPAQGSRAAPGEREAREGENLERALDYARRSLDHAPDELKQFPLAVLGWIHYKRGELGEAIDFLAKSSELAPSSTTLTHLGMALLASGDEERARAVLDRARGLTDRGAALGSKMMQLMKDSNRILERVR